MDQTKQTAVMVEKAHNRIIKYVHKTPIIQLEHLNEMVNNNVYFKMDSMQITGAFKIRGVLNFLLSMKEKTNLPTKIVAYSTGNHALAMAYAAKMLNIIARVYLPKNVSLIKKNIAAYYGAEIIEVDTRQQAEDLALHDSLNGFTYLHPSDNDLTIAGAGTMCFEALLEMQTMNIFPDYIFAPCGGGGLLAGSYLAKDLLSPNTKLHGVEPLTANDAHKTLESGSLFRFKNSPDTVADGLRALSVSMRTLEYLKKLDGFHLVSEESILFWTAYLIQEMKQPCEPSAAISIAAAHEMIKVNNIHGKKILILITGGNIDPEFYLKMSRMDIAVVN